MSVAEDTDFQVFGCCFLKCKKFEVAFIFVLLGINLRNLPWYFSSEVVGSDKYKSQLL